MYVKYNANPAGKNVGDCVVRAISKVLGEDWEKVYCGVTIQGFRLFDMPSANHVWGSYLRERGLKRTPMPDTCPDCYTVKEFCKEHPHGIYLLALQSHVVAVQDGNYFDTWDSGDQTVLYYWQKEEK